MITCGGKGRSCPNPILARTPTLGDTRGGLYRDVPKLEPGRQTIELRNGAPDERGFILFSPEAGKTLEDIGKWGESGFKGPAPATFLGAMQSIPPGTSAFLTLELEAGKPYVFFDEQNETAFTVSD